MMQSLLLAFNENTPIKSVVSDSASIYFISISKPWHALYQSEK